MRNRSVWTALALIGAAGFAPVALAQTQWNPNSVQPVPGNNPLTAVANGVVINQPVLSNVESVGPRTTISFNVPAGLNAGGVIPAGNLSSAYLVGLDASGNIVAGTATSVSALLVATPAYNNGAGNADVRIDLSAGVGTLAIFTNPAVRSIGIRITSGADPAGLSAGAQTAWNADIATTNSSNVTALPVATPLNLTNAYLATVGGNPRAFLVFNRRMVGTTGAFPGGNDGNQGGAVAAADFQINATSTFAGSEPAPTLLTVGGGDGWLASANNSIYRFTVGGGSTYVLGSFVRPAYNAGGVPTFSTTALRDFVKNLPTASSAAITAPPALAASGSAAIAPLGAGGSAANIFRVTFNNPIANSGAISTDCFQIRVNSNSVVSDLQVTGISADPSDPNSIRLSINDTGFTGVGPDGRAAVGFGGGGPAGVFTVRVITGTTPPQDIFGNNFSGSADLTAADKIAPSLVGVSYHDLNGDGNLDAVAYVFNEPMTAITSSTGFTLLRVANQTVRPKQLIDPLTGALTPTTTGATAGTVPQNTIPITSVGLGSVFTTNFTNTNVRESNNAIVIQFNPLTFDWNLNGTSGTGTGGVLNDANEPIPGTNDPNALSIGATGINFTDAAGNLTVSPIPAPGAPTIKRTGPVLVNAFFYAGHNQNGADNAQYFSQQSGDVGRSILLNRAALVYTEAVNNGALVRQNIRFGPGGTRSFSTNTSGDFVGGPDGNILTLQNNSIPNNGNADLVPGTTISTIAPVYNPGSSSLGAGIRDGGGNNPSPAGSAVLQDRRAPFALLTSDVDGTTTFIQAFLIDSNGNGFADRVDITMSEAVATSPALAASDFSINQGGSVSGAPTVSGNTISVPLTDGVIAMTSTPTLTYNGASALNRVRDTATPANLVSAINDSFSVRAVPGANRPVQDVAIMPFLGTITGTDGNPAPINTKVYAFIAYPTVSRVSFQANGVPVNYDRNQGTSNTNSTINAMTNWWLGLQDFVYYDNNRFRTDFSDDYVPITFANATNVNGITFTGKATIGNSFTYSTGGGNATVITNGRLEFCWDVLRSSGGLVESLYGRNNVNNTGAGFDIGAKPIASRGVVDNPAQAGTYRMHVSGPVAAFDGRKNLDATGRPIIFVVELPDGTRYAVSGLLSSVNGAPILFNANNRNQGQNGASADEASNATRFDIDLRRVGNKTAWPGWNLVGYDRNSGYAASTAARPVLPSAITSANVRVAPLLPWTSALENFVYFTDDDANGKWTSNDDDGNQFDSLIIDPDCTRYFAFTMTSFGVQLNTGNGLNQGINNVVGGYGVALFLNRSAGNSPLGIFQFGAAVPTTQANFFGTSAAFPNNSTTQGWSLLTSFANFDNSGSGFPANITGGTTNNGKLDYVITFQNRGISVSPQIVVTSRDLQPAGAPNATNNVNSTTGISAGQAFFGHFRR
ncbi:MAG: hypothetical protein IBJ11_04355 [Phycisphaerales bacterium]|nr:hypothetical protein [Phycisphaerales bacterium]